MTATEQFDHPLLPSDDEFERIKQSVLLSIELPERPARQSNTHVPIRRRARGRRLRWGAVTVGATLALVAGLVLTDTIGIAGLRPGATASAAELLNRVADTTITTTDPALRTGQLLRVATKDVHFIETGNAQDQTVFFGITETSTTWIPADPHAAWTRVSFPTRATKDSFGPGAAQLAEEQDKTWRKQPPEILHGKNGNYFGGDATWSPASVTTLSRDPRVLLNHIYRVTVGTGNSADDEALVTIGDILRSGLAPADLRAALYRAAAMIPGVTITANAATLDGTTGVAIGRVEESNGIRQDLIIDPDNGLLIGERRVTTKPIDLYPTGTTLEWSVSTTTVVDELPAAYR